jgi:hypothetical protein
MQRVVGTAEVKRIFYVGSRCTPSDKLQLWTSHDDATDQVRSPHEDNVGSCTGETHTSVRDNLRSMHW